ncbi:MAG: histidine--tRNA ligase [Patescibacteria group bacterium]
MALSTQPVKGARDFYPEDMRLQKYIYAKWREVCERYGYEEYDAPILEPTELYLSKGNQEIINDQTYTFEDRGGRSMTLRTEMTPTVSRMIAGKRQELAYPARWYSIPQFWRYERMQRGRGREFYQLNADIFGIADLAADLEIIDMADAVMQAFGAKRETYAIKVNSRKLVDSFLTGNLGLDQTQADTARRLIDRMRKMDQPAFVAQLDAIISPSQRENGVGSRLLQFLETPTLNEIPEELLGNESVAELKLLLEKLGNNGVTNAQFDPTLMRGFDYYTDIAFEVFDTDPENNRSMFGGGRYDGLVSMFGVEPIPAVGFAMGDITLKLFLEAHGLMPALMPETDIYIVLIGEVADKAQAPIKQLREMGLNVAVDQTGRKPESQIKTAVKKGIGYVLFIGERELEESKFMLKNLHSKEEEAHSLERIVSIIKDYRKQ